jgi:hypothetical protein
MWTDVLLAGSLVFFIAYFCWYLFVGKTLQPVTTEEIELMWRLHRTQTGCNGSRITDLLSYRNKVVGYRCECGYEFRQKRLLAQNVQKVPSPVHSTYQRDATLGKE